MAGSEPLHLRVFLSSPGDVSEERVLARQVIAELPRKPLLKGKVTLDVIAYDDPDAPAPMSESETPQSSVNLYSGRPADCDLTLVILWSRLGTPLPAEIVRRDGTRYESGTVWELEDAREARKEVFVYWRKETPRVDMDDPALSAKLAAYAGVKAFFKKFSNEDGSLARGFNGYADPAEFQRLLEKHLETFINARFAAADNDRSVDAGRERDGPLETLRRSARTILKLYTAKAVHDILHEIYLRSQILRADDLAQIDGRMISKLASYCEAKLVSIDAEVTQCAPHLDDAERIKINGFRPKFEAGIAKLATAADSSDERERANAVDAFTRPLDAWLTQLDGCLKELADRLNVEEIRAAILLLKEKYAPELKSVELSLERLTAEANPVLLKCRALSDAHHGLQYVHDELPGLINRVTADDAELAPGEWRALKRRLVSARKAWEGFGELPAGESDWEEDVRDDGQATWPVVNACIMDLDDILTEQVDPNAVLKSVRPLTRLQARVEKHFKIVDQALREGYAMFKEGVGRPIMEIGSDRQAVSERV